MSECHRCLTLNFKEKVGGQKKRIIFVLLLYDCKNVNKLLSKYRNQPNNYQLLVVACLVFIIFLFMPSWAWEKNDKKAKSERKKSYTTVV